MHAVLDQATATRLLTGTFAAATAVTDQITRNGPGTDPRILWATVHQVPAHPVRTNTQTDPIDKTTGAVYTGPRIVVRDPAQRPTPQPPADPADYHISGTVDGVHVVGTQQGPSPDVAVALEFDPAIIAGSRERAVDVYTVALLNHIAGTSQKAAVFHYAGTWTFGSDPAGAATLRTVLPPDQLPLPVADQFHMVDS